MSFFVDGRYWITPTMAFIKSKLTQSLSFVLFLFLIIVGSVPSLARTPHAINFRSPNLYPEGFTWDPQAQHFIVGSLTHRSIHSVSDAAVVQTLIYDSSLPENSTVLGLTIDSVHNRLLAVVMSIPPLPPLNALAAYDLRTRRRVFLSLLDDDVDSAAPPGANDVAVDFDGNAYVTNSIGNFIWKVNKDGEASVFSRSPAFTAYLSAVDADVFGSACGLNGIAYVSKGYLLVVQSNTGKMFKVNVEDGSAKRVLLSEDMTLADDIVIRSDGVVLVVSAQALYFLKSEDSWAEGVLYDKIALDEERFATGVATGGEGRAYVLYGHVKEGIMGNSGREEFGIAEVRSKKEGQEENVWIFVLLGLGLAYFLFWRFQMKKLVKDMGKKIN